mmetsp:Transcript_26382/g.66961  ORF Transcript_26382/g.66961 Transcript_26382/m.66961 type:complete len:350 (+) Transcript_26382:1028-2077(+)
MRSALELEDGALLAEGDRARAIHRLGALGHDPGAVATRDRVGRVQAHALLEDAARIVKRQQLGVALARPVEDTQRELALHVVQLGAHLAAVLAVLACVGDSVAVDMENQLGVELEHGKGLHQRAHLKALGVARTAHQHVAQIDWLWPRRVGAVEHVTRHRLREHGAERVLQHAVQLAQPGGEGSVVLAQDDGAGRDTVLVQLLERGECAHRREHPVLHLVPREAVRLLVLLTTDGLGNQTLLRSLTQQGLLRVVPRDAVGYVADHHHQRRTVGQRGRVRFAAERAQARALHAVLAQEHRGPAARVRLDFHRFIPRGVDHVQKEVFVRRRQRLFCALCVVVRGRGREAHG